MPFISKDWRSPGDYWVKNGSGWERFKVLRFISGSTEAGQEAEQQNQQQPHCRINLRQTREVDLIDLQSQPDGPYKFILNYQDHLTKFVRLRPMKSKTTVETAHTILDIFCEMGAPHILQSDNGREFSNEISMTNTLSEALQLLDFQNALRDQRKFQYICVIIRLLISNPLLGGNSQRILVKLLFQICDQVRIPQLGVVGWRYDLLRIIIHEMRKSLDNCWGGNLGSAQLWNENKSKIDKIEELMATYREETPKIPLQEFPEDIIRLIILKLNNDKDLRNLAESDETLKRLVSENRIWRQLCIYHFSRENIINTAMRLKAQQQQQQRNNPFNHHPRTRQSIPMNENNNNQENEDPMDVNANSHHPLHNNNNQQQNQQQQQQEEGKELIDWENFYKYLKRNFRLKEDYAEVLNYCKPCNVLFWPSFGHPCIVGTSVFLDKDDKENTNFLVDVRPCDFVSFFST